MNAHALRLGHVQLRVRDLERSKAFYQGLLGLPLRESRRGMAFLGAGPEHHQLALHAVGENAAASPPLGVGLSHVAFEVPDRGALLGMHRALVAAG